MNDADLFVPFACVLLKDVPDYFWRRVSEDLMAFQMNTPLKMFATGSKCIVKYTTINQKQSWIGCRGS